MTESALLIVSADVIPGKEEDFNSWYNGHHIPDFAERMPYVQKIRRFYSKRGSPRFITIYEYASFDDLKKSLSSEEANQAAADADLQVGKVATSFTFSSYSQIYP